MKISIKIKVCRYRNFGDGVPEKKLIRKIENKEKCTKENKDHVNGPPINKFITYHF